MTEAIGRSGKSKLNQGWRKLRGAWGAGIWEDLFPTSNCVVKLIAHIFQEIILCISGEAIRVAKANEDESDKTAKNKLCRENASD